MKDTEVIDKAIKKVQATGWDEFKSQYARVFKQGNDVLIEFLVGVDLPSIVVSVERVIFSPSFAEHLWGLDTWYFVVHHDQGGGMDNSVIGWKSEKEMEEAATQWAYYDNIPAYEYHLQQLALEGSQTARVSYIETFL